MQGVGVAYLNVRSCKYKKTCLRAYPHRGVSHFACNQHTTVPRAHIIGCRDGDNRYGEAVFVVFLLGGVNTANEEDGHSPATLGFTLSTNRSGPDSVHVCTHARTPGRQGQELGRLSACGLCTALTLAPPV